MSIPFALAEQRCACGSTELLAVAPGDSGDADDPVIDLFNRRPDVPARCWCASCWLTSLARMP